MNTRRFLTGERILPIWDSCLKLAKTWPSGRMAGRRRFTTSGRLPPRRRGRSTRATPTRLGRPPPLPLHRPVRRGGDPRRGSTRLAVHPRCLAPAVALPYLAVRLHPGRAGSAPQLEMGGVEAMVALGRPLRAALTAHRPRCHHQPAGGGWERRSAQLYAAQRGGRRGRSKELPRFEVPGRNQSSPDGPLRAGGAVPGVFTRLVQARRGYCRSLLVGPGTGGAGISNPPPGAVQITTPPSLRRGRGFSCPAADAPG